ncbi:uncharacterized protein PHALS_01714 [Plasmopara halstedii]|uniref:Uncharacterized protein n=1 Tax=Plasmopara halstedii TaxID=4781 RepID=A0A0P1ATK1_PLAHL|nr:uncharacterized protein PHALS_01714 [Plasmopara halstedii]CEG45416.1 hypothetical protein PHALS_01714 [Plasmopara halstedii]|eukprot:XP_024581785.1 hypothetical protein PHALS_01714 [Plasmopara halstedii]
MKRMHVDVVNAVEWSAALEALITAYRGESRRTLAATSRIRIKSIASSGGPVGEKLQYPRLRKEKVDGVEEDEVDDENARDWIEQEDELCWRRFRRDQLVLVETGYISPASGQAGYEAV